MAKHSSIRILVVDDEVDHADVIAEAITRMGYSVKTAHHLADARRFLTDDDFQLVITDLKMDSPTDGFDLLQFAKRNKPSVEVIVITAHGDVSTAVEAMRNGAYDFIQKPLDLDMIRTQVRRAVEKVQLQQINTDLTKALDQKFGMNAIVGNSEPMQRVLTLISQYAPTDISVFITGESGTGKELVARALHQNSRRASGKFVALNCAGLNESTLEDELFGHVRGAFTDARGDRAGRFEYADGGTLFLDEIGDMPLAMQAKLLRVLQDREITRLGSNDPIKVDVRFISATNKDLGAAVADRSFREDLYFRIKAATIALPPLRQRRDDIPLLIAHFLEKANARLGKHITGMDAAARNSLVAYAWPGNIRQLENVIENMAILASGEKLTLNDLPPEIAGDAGVVTSTALIPLPTTTSTAMVPVGGTIADMERQMIEKTLAMMHGNREQTAKVLGIGERTLYRKIKEFGLGE